MFVTPMNQKIILLPGERYDGIITIFNPSDEENTLNYFISTVPFSVTGEGYENNFETETDSNQILKWISFDTQQGSLEPNKKEAITFHIDVPENAPAGGQYLAILITSDLENDTDSNISIGSSIEIASIVYATIIGDTIESGEIITNDFPIFSLKTPVKGTIVLKNSGNIHTEAKTTLQIFPLFSNEEIFTTEETPATNLTMPNTTRLFFTTWDGGPKIGIFHVVQTVEYVGETSILNKYIIICPIWVVILIFVSLLLIIICDLGEKHTKTKKGQ